LRTPYTSIASSTRWIAGAPNTRHTPTSSASSSPAPRTERGDVFQAEEVLPERDVSALDRDQPLEHAAQLAVTRHSRSDRRAQIEQLVEHELLRERGLDRLRCGPRHAPTSASAP
jgi:hypothetical protein